MSSLAHDDLYDIIRLEGNTTCADCGAKSPRWASINIGVLICLECSGIHRGMGVHISHVKSLTLDSWTPERIDVLRRIGNTLGRAYYEYQVPSGTVRPTHHHMRKLAMQTWISNKYDKKLFAPQETLEPYQLLKLGKDPWLALPQHCRPSTHPKEDLFTMSLSDASPKTSLTTNPSSRHETVCSDTTRKKITKKQSDVAQGTKKNIHPWREKHSSSVTESLLDDSPVNSLPGACTTPRDPTPLSSTLPSTLSMEPKLLYDFIQQKATDLDHLAHKNPSCTFPTESFQKAVWPNKNPYELSIDTKNDSFSSLTNLFEHIDCSYESKGLMSCEQVPLQNPLSSARPEEKKDLETKSTLGPPTLSSPLDSHKTETFHDTYQDVLFRNLDQLQDFFDHQSDAFHSTGLTLEESKDDQQVNRNYPHSVSNHHVAEAGLSHDDMGLLDSQFIKLFHQMTQYNDSVSPSQGSESHFFNVNECSNSVALS